jgi:ornithine carbamoyltransferase
MAKPPQHFRDLADFSGDVLHGLVATARRMKDQRMGLAKGHRESTLPLQGKILAMIFERPSTRTRISFEVAMRQLGGEALIISANDTQLGRGESIGDTARVLSRYVDGIMIRAAKHQHLTELADNASIPVINGLTNISHPCQALADVMTLEEHKGPLAGQKIAWVGDGNNVARSWIEAVTLMGGALRLGCPSALSPAPDILDWAAARRGDVTVMTDPDDAVAEATCVMTDAWVSMHDADAASRHNLLAPYQVNQRLIGKAAPGAVFMHCLPAHRNEEVTDQVMDGPQSVVFDQAENRLHIQKSILLHCLGDHG